MNSHPGQGPDAGARDQPAQIAIPERRRSTSPNAPSKLLALPPLRPNFRTLIGFRLGRTTVEVAAASDMQYISVGQELPVTNPHSPLSVTQARVSFAVRWLEQRGILAGKRSHKLSARVDPGLLRAARDRLGEHSDTEVVNAALAVLAGGDEFGVWLVGRSGRLPEDFELEF